MIARVLTIGVYGFNERSFMETLTGAGVDLFIDIRARRGVRGAAYAFANSKRLQASLESAGITYTHAKELAPSKKTRDAQWQADKAAHIAKRDRARLSEAFIDTYERETLSGFSADAFAERYINGSRRPVLFCVEREPCACHRSLVAERIGQELSVPVQNLMP